MRSASGRQLGHIRTIEVDMNRAHSAQGVTFDLGKLPSKVGKQRISVLGYVITAPVVALTIPIAKVLDGLSWAQLITSLTVRMSDGSPPSKRSNGHMVIEAVDGPRAFQALQYWGRTNVIRVTGGGPYVDITAPTGGASTVFNGALPLSGNLGDDSRPLQLQAPLGYGGSAATSAFSDTPTFYIPLVPGVSESKRKSGASAEWWNGEGFGAPGAITIIPATTIDGIAITSYTGTWSLKAVVFVHPDGRIPLPVTPHMRIVQDVGKQIKLLPGIRVAAWLMKPLVAGATAVYDVTRVSAYDAEGNLLNNPDISQLLEGHQFGNDERPMWKPRQLGSGSAPTNPTLPQRNANHHIQWGIPLLSWDGANTFAPGDALGPTTLSFDLTGEATQYVLDFVLTPNDDALEGAALQSEGADAKADDVGMNGRHVPDDVRGLVPREIQVPSAMRGFASSVKASIQNAAAKLAPNRVSPISNVKG